MQFAPHKAPLYLGSLLVVMGLLFNRWLIETVFVADHTIDSSRSLFFIAACQAAMIGLGALLITKRRAINLSVKAPERSEVILLLASVLAVLLVVEIGLRAAGYNPFGDLAEGRQLILRASSVKQRIYEATPHAEGHAWGTDVRINSYGFRDKDYDLRKPAGTQRVIVIGDSVAFGNFLRPEETFVRQFDRLANAADRNVEVLNLALGGYDTLQEVATLEAIGVQFKPDVVVVGFVVNDVEVASTNLAYILRARTYGSFIYKSRLMQFVRSRLDTLLLGQDMAGANLEATFATDNRDYIADTTTDPELAGIMRKLRGQLDKQGADATAFNVAQYLSHARVGKLRYSLEMLDRLERQHGFTVLVMIVPYLLEKSGNADTFRLIYDIVEHESARLGFDVLRVDEPFEATGYDQLALPGWDRIHPNAQGHALIAKVLFERLYGNGRSTASGQ